MKKQKTEEVVYGLNAALAVFKHRPSSIIRCYLDKNIKQKLGENLKFLAKQKSAYHLVDKSELDKLTSTTHHEGISLLVRRRAVLRPIQAFSKLRGRVLIIALSGVQNPHNIGAIARSAAHFGANGIILPDKFDPPAAAYRVAEGGLESLIVANGSSEEIYGLKASDFKLIAASPHQGTALNKYKFPQKSVIVFGAEGEGLDKTFEKKCDAFVNISGSGDVESLNVSSAAAVLLYAATLK